MAHRATSSAGTPRRDDTTRSHHRRQDKADGSVRWHWPAPAGVQDLAAVGTVNPTPVIV